MTIKKVMDMVDFLPTDMHKEQIKITVKKKLFNESAKMAQSLNDNKFLLNLHHFISFNGLIEPVRKAATFIPFVPCYPLNWQ